MDAQEWVALAGVLAWPTAAIVLGVVFRRPLGAFLASISGRVSKVSVMSVSVELAVAQSADPPWRGVGGEDVRGLVAAQMVNDSYFDTLRRALDVEGPTDYFVVDLRDGGREWLTSRLYLFAYILGYLKGTRAVVFLATRDDLPRAFLAVAPVENVLRRLAAQYPWFAEARSTVEETLIPSTTRILPSGVAITHRQNVDEWRQGVRDGSSTSPLYIASTFLEQIQTTVAPVGAGEDEWLAIPSKGGGEAWEHGAWLRRRDLTDGFLREAACFECRVVDQISWSDEARAAAVAAAPGELVALVGAEREFLRLIDKNALLTALGRRLLDSRSAR